MKSTHQWITIAMMITLVGLGWNVVAMAYPSDPAEAEQEATQQEGVEQRDSHGDLATFSEVVHVESEVDGDVVVAGSEVRVTEAVHGYVLAAGSTVTIDGAIDDDLWAAGQKVSLNKPVADNAWLAGRSVQLGPDSRVGRDVHVAGESVEILGAIERDLHLAASDATIDSEVGGSVHAFAGRLKLLPDAVIHGDLIVTSPKPPEMQADAQVLGRIVHHAEEADDENGVWSWLLSWAGTFLMFLVLGVATIAFSASWTNRIASNLSRRPLRSLVTGVVGLLVIPLLCLFLLVTVIGIPLAIVSMAIFIAALLLSCVFVSCSLGKWLLKNLGTSGESPLKALAVGAFLLALFVSLPWIGGVVQFAVILLGLGALVLEATVGRGGEGIRSAAPNI